MIGASASSLAAARCPHRCRVPDRRHRRFFPQNIGRFVRSAVIFDQRLAEFFRAGADQLDLALKQKTQTVDGVEIERIANRDDQSVLTAGDRNNFEPARVFAADLIDDFRRNNHRREVDPVHVRLGRKRARDVHLRQSAVVNQNIEHAGLAVQTRARAIDLLAR